MPAHQAHQRRIAIRQQRLRAAARLAERGCVPPMDIPTTDFRA